MDSGNQQGVEPTALAHGAQKNGEHEPLAQAVKTYNTRDGWTLHRFASATGFSCTRCKKRKKAKLVATQDGSLGNLYCNGCYGQHLSIA